MRPTKSLSSIVLVAVGLPAQLQEIRSRAGGPGDLAGRAVALIGDVDGDGVPGVVVGGPGSQGGAGSVQVLWGADLVVLRSVVASPGEGVGFSVDRARDLDGDGVPDWIAGSAGDPFGGGGRATGPRASCSSAMGR